MQIPSNYIAFSRSTPLPLPVVWSRLHFFLADRVQHDLVGQLLVVGGVALAPVVTDGIGEDVAVAVEGGAGDGTAHGGISL